MYFTKKELLMSLCCPAITALWGLFHLILDFPWGRDFSEKGFFLLLYPALIGLAAVLAGGVLPAYLTLSHKVHTEKHLIKRLIAIAAVYAIIKFFGRVPIYGATDFTFFALYMIVRRSAVLIQILTVKKQDTSPGERAVLILSDPILYWTIYYFAYYIVVLV